MADLVRTTAELAEAAAAVRSESLVALDTEFVWRNTYHPQLGIVQMGCRALNVAIDCRSTINTAAFREVLEDGGIVKILHDCRQDLMHIHRYTGAKPKNVFDTQYAAAFAGFPAKTGLQKLLFEAIGVGLAKTETCTDWLQRPLSEAQVRYALDDVRYLPDLREELLACMDRLGTRLFFEEDAAGFDDPLQYADYDPENVWKRIKTGRLRLDGRGRAALKALASLREDTAANWNLPRAWLGDDLSLAKMADSGRADCLRHRLRGGKGDTLKAIYQAAIDKARNTPRDEWPDDPRPSYITEVLENADKAFAWLGERAAAVSIDASVVASRATVTAFVDNVDDEANPLACGWRYELFGRDIAEMFGVD